MFILIFNLKISKQINDLMHFKTRGLKHKMKTSIKFFFYLHLTYIKPHHTVLPLT